MMRYNKKVSRGNGYKSQMKEGINYGITKGTKGKNRGFNSK